jgi:hypothetical protein
LSTGLGEDFGLQLHGREMVLRVSPDSSHSEVRTIRPFRADFVGANRDEVAPPERRMDIVLIGAITAVK